MPARKFVCKLPSLSREFEVDAWSADADGATLALRGGGFGSKRTCTLAGDACPCSLTTNLLAAPISREDTSVTGQIVMPIAT